jgi:hypothetical protein
VNVLVKLRALSAEDAVPVFHAQGDAGEAVVLGDADGTAAALQSGENLAGIV